MKRYLVNKKYFKNKFNPKNYFTFPTKVPQSSLENSKTDFKEQQPTKVT